MPDETRTAKARAAIDEAAAAYLHRNRGPKDAEFTQAITSAVHLLADELDDLRRHVGRGNTEH